MCNVGSSLSLALGALHSLCSCCCIIWTPQSLPALLLFVLCAVVAADPLPALAALLGEQLSVVAVAVVAAVAPRLVGTGSPVPAAGLVDAAAVVVGAAYPAWPSAVSWTDSLVHPVGSSQTSDALWC